MLHLIKVNSRSMKGFDSRTVGHHRRKSLELLHERLERVRDHAVVAAVRHEQHLLRLVEVCLALVELVLRKKNISKFPIFSHKKPSRYNKG